MPLLREDVEMHLKTTCPSQEIRCEFHYTGCNIIVKLRKYMPDHLKENTELHLQMLSDKHEKINVRCHELEVQNQEDQNQELKFQLECYEKQYEKLEKKETTTAELKEFKDNYENLSTQYEHVKCIYVTNLPDGANAQHLRSIFVGSGKITELEHFPERNAAIVCYMHPHQYAAIFNRSKENRHGITLLKRRLKLNAIF